jgi:NADPH2:quinone reductase
MLAIGHTEFGGPEVLHEVELPDPVAGPGEVRIRVRAAAVNATDTVRRAGMLAKVMNGEDRPYVPGMELAGVLEEIGPDSTTDLSVGDHVMGILVPRGSFGAYCEQIVLPAESVTRVPAGVDDVAASTLPMNGLTARMTLDRLHLTPGQAVGVTGVAGAYGGYVVQLAKAEVLYVVADAAEKDRALVEGLGADTVVPRGDDVADRFLDVVPGGVDGLADGAVLNEKVIRAIRPGGRLATVRYYEGEPVNGVTYHPVRVRHYVRERAKLDRLRALVEEGKVTPRVARTYPAAQAAEAHRRLALGGTRGRLVLVFGG